MNSSAHDKDFLQHILDFGGEYAFREIKQELKDAMETAKE